ncbi:MAG: hypothetical protein H6657_21130 [Ardenticatenaceae bacterium]|nr:hypothetical protein [Anaerolineales bacterium]MCB8979922.1 hypothetical protein [Ardenticatenaceae bacterium]
MLYFYMDEKIAEARVNAVIEDAKERRLTNQTGKVDREYNFRLPDLSTLFKNWKVGQKTAVATQA